MTCPLCNGSTSRREWEVSLGDVVNAINHNYGTEFTPSSIAKFDPNLETELLERCLLLECLSCGLQYFDPMLEGNAHFYAGLGKEGWTKAPRWDHLAFLKKAASKSRIIDLGGGNDVFIDAAASNGADCTSIDFVESDFSMEIDPSATRISLDLSDNAQRSEALAVFGANADFVTAFHVLEHLSDPLAFAGFAVKLLKPGGTLVISVPNRERFDLSVNQALDCPPHHQTRWGAQQLRVLGRSLSASEVRVRRELRFHPKILFGGPIYWWNERRKNPDLDFGSVGRPWPIWRVPQGLSLLASFKF